MRFFNIISEFFGFGSSDVLGDSVTNMGANNLTNINNSLDDFTINPATGLPMVNGMGGVDVAGNPYGVDNSHHDSFGSSFDSGSSFGSHDSFGSTFDSGSSFGGGFGSDW